MHTSFTITNESYDAMIAERDNLQAQVARLSRQLAMAKSTMTPEDLKIYHVADDLFKVLN